MGHLFQGRFKAILVDRETYLLEVCRYVELNPVRPAMVAEPGEWAWSSYRAHVGACGRGGHPAVAGHGWMLACECAGLDKVTAIDLFPAVDAGLMGAFQSGDQ